MNRIDRLHAILTHLQSKKKVTAQDIADRFKMSLRTVYRDIKALEESGVPIIGEAGIGYSVMEGYRLPPVMFTQEEAAAILLAGKLAAQMTDGSVKKHFDAALFKIKAVLRTNDKEHVDNLTSHIEVLQSRSVANEPDNQYLAALQKAIVDKKIIVVRYHSPYSETFTERELEPIGLCYYGSAWHVISWCRLRKDYRDFRVSRIVRLHTKDEGFENKAHQSLQQYLDKMATHGELQQMVVRFNKTACKYMGEQKYLYGYVKEEKEEDFVRMHFLTAYPEGFARWLLMFTNAVTIESPLTLQMMMKELADELHIHYADRPVMINSLA